MHDQKQNMIPRVEPKKVGPKQRRMFDVDRFQGCLPSFQLRLCEQECLGSGTLGSGPGGKIVHNQNGFDVGFRHHESDGEFVPPGKSSAQRGVPTRDVGKAALERWHVQRTLQPISEGQVELG